MGARQPAVRSPPRTGCLARRDTPTASGRGAATRDQLPAARLGQPPRPSAELRDADRQPLGFQRHQRRRDELGAARPRLRTPPGNRYRADGLAVVGVLGVTQGRQGCSLLGRHQVRDSNRRSRRRPLPPAPGGPVPPKLSPGDKKGTLGSRASARGLVRVSAVRVKPALPRQPTDRGTGLDQPCRKRLSRRLHELGGSTPWVWSACTALTGPAPRGSGGGQSQPSRARG